MSENRTAEIIADLMEIVLWDKHPKNKKDFAFMLWCFSLHDAVIFAIDGKHWALSDIQDILGQNIISEAISEDGTWHIILISPEHHEQLLFNVQSRAEGKLCDMRDIDLQTFIAKNDLKAASDFYGGRVQFKTYEVEPNLFYDDQEAWLQEKV